MKQIDPEREWKILNFEMFENQPACDPYPEDVIKRRELLLMAQCELSSFQAAKSKKEKKFHAELYEKIMEYYFNW